MFSSLHFHHWRKLGQELKQDRGPEEKADAEAMGHAAHPAFLQKPGPPAQGRHNPQGARSSPVTP